MIASGSEKRSCVSSHMSEHLESERGRFNPNRCVLGGDRRQTVSSHHLAQTEVHSDLHMVKNGKRLRAEAAHARHRCKTFECMWEFMVELIVCWFFFAVMLHAVNWDLLWEKATARKSLCNYDPAP